MKTLARIVAVLLVVSIAACGGDDDGLQCDLDDATTLADSDWPMARHDMNNTARFDAADVVLAEAPIATCIFPGNTLPVEGDIADCAEGGSPITTTAINGMIGGRTSDTGEVGVPKPGLVVATQDGLVHPLEYDGTEIDLEMEIDLLSAVNTPLLGLDGSIFVTTASGLVRRYSGDDGEQLFTASFLDDIEVAPNIGPDGVIYAGTAGGFFGAVCPNSATRFARAVGAVSVPAAVFPNPDDPEKTIVLATGDGGRVLALDDDRGELQWSFFTGGRIRRSAVVVDTGLNIFIIADSQGQIFAASTRNGLPRNDDGDALMAYRVARCIPSLTSCLSSADCASGETCQTETITASPALGEDHVYIATEGVQTDTGSVLSPGYLYAFSLDFAGDPADWTWTPPGGGILRSSPVLIADGEIVVLGLDIDCSGSQCSRGAIAAVQDGELLWMIELPDPVGVASAAVRRDEDGTGIVYVGTAGGKLYEVR